MQIERIKLVNFGPHEEFEFEPSPRLTGIIGPNGSGKSTILSAIEFLVTGVVPTAGNKLLNVCQLAAAKAPAWVEGVIHHNGRRIEIARGLRGVSSRLLLDGSRTPIVGENAITAELTAVFGGSAALFSDYVFVKQSAITALLNMTKSVRAEAYAQLFGTAGVEKCYSLVDKRLNSLTAPTIAIDIDSARRGLEADRRELAVARNCRAAYDDVKGYNRDEDPNHTIVINRHAWAKAREQRDVAIAEATSIAADLAKYEKLVEESDHRLELAEVALKTATAEAVLGTAALEAWRLVDQHKRAGDSLDARAAALEKEHAKNKKPEVPPPGTVELSVKESEIYHKLANDNDFIRKFKAAGELCPTCGRPAAELASDVATREAGLVALNAEHAKARAASKLLADYTAAQKAWKIWVAGYKERREAYERDLAAHEKAAKTETPAMSRADAEAAIEARKAAQLSYDAVKDKRASRQREVAAKTGELKTAERQVKVLTETVRKTKVSKEDYLAAKDALKATVARVAERNQLTGQIKALKASAERWADAVTAAEEAAKAAEGIQRVRTRLSSIRDVLHRDNLPKRVSAAYLAAIDGDINRRLGRFGTNFTVVPEDDLSYSAVFDDGRRQPAIRLSGGQQVLLSLAFRVSVNAFFAGAIGLLCLDEPTEALDDNNIRCLDTALGELRELSATTGLQCLMVTHAKPLTRLFDKVIELNL